MRTMRWTRKWPASAVAPLATAAFFGLTFGLMTAPYHAHANVGDWWLKGASVIPGSSGDFSSDNFKQSVRNWQADGGTYVNFVVPLRQSNLYSSDIGPRYNTPSDSALAAGIDYAHSLGLHAEISIYLESDTGDWRANISANDRDAWYKAYGDELTHYGQIASAHGVELYALGAELVKMASVSANADNTSRWDGMIGRVRGVYGGKLTYTANRGEQGWASELPNIGFWDRLDYVGISAYYELPGDGSVSSMKNGWQNANDYDVSSIHNKTGKPVIFSEVGYRSVSGSYERPWDSWDGGNYDAQAQKNAYEALLEYWNDYGFMQGVDLWWWSPDPTYGGQGNTDYTPHNKPAEQTLTNWWSGSGGSGGGGGSSGGGGSGSTAPAPGTPVDNWWPVDGAHLSGLQPFKAMFDGGDVSTYDMYWQVGNGNLVPMYDSNQEWPHKEAWVDFSGWTWEGNGPYRIVFTGKRKSDGAVISSKSLDIWIP